MLNHSRAGLPVAFVMRGVLERTSVNAAAAFLEDVPHASGQHYALADPDASRATSALRPARCAPTTARAACATPTIRCAAATSIRPMRPRARRTRTPGLRRSKRPRRTCGRGPTASGCWQTATPHSASSPCPAGPGSPSGRSGPSSTRRHVCASRRGRPTAPPGSKPRLRLRAVAPDGLEGSPQEPRDVHLRDPQPLGDLGLRQLEPKPQGNDDL